MRRLRVAALSVAAIPVAACSFLIDFGELGSGRRSNVDAGDGGADASDAGDPCPEPCDDHDSCTVDECTPKGCRSTYTPNIVADGLDETIPGDAFHRVTMTTVGNRFYLSALKSAGGSYDLELRSFGGSEARTTSAGDFSSLAKLGADVPVSAAGLTSNQGRELVAYIAVGGSPSTPAHVWRATFDATMKLSTASAITQDENYVGSRRTHPATWTLGDGTVWAAWPGSSGGVYLHTGTSTIPAGELPALGQDQGQVFSLSPLSVNSTVPAVLFVTDRPYLQAYKQKSPVALVQCDERAGTFLSTASAYTTLSGIWLTSWTKTVGNTFVTEQTTIVCVPSATNPSCVGPLQCGDKQPVPSVRNPAVTIAHDDTTNRTYEIAVIPTVDATKNVVNLILHAIGTNFGAIQTDDAAGVVTEVAPPETIASATLGSHGEGPDFPELVFDGKDKLGIAWIEPSSGTGDELRILRRRICLPK